MLDIGRHIDSVHSDDTGETILGVINSVKRNKILMLHASDTGYVDLTTANQYRRLEFPPFLRWRVIGIGMFFIAVTTANEDPVVDFGDSADPDSMGKMTSVITGGEKFCKNDHIKYDPLGISAPEVLAEASATLGITWTVGVEFNVWQDTFMDIWVQEAAAAGISSGRVRPYMIA